MCMLSVLFRDEPATNVRLLDVVKAGRTLLARSACQLDQQPEN